MIIIGTVDKIVRNGRHGPYAVASSDIGPVTFSLERPVWLEEEWPERGIMVVLSDPRKKPAGWRAYKARFLRPDDQENREETKDGVKE
ncbi:MAG TPA: hypothetical protein VJ485_04945 [archaeon]|nr:hypothetical protein [archaeon]